MKFVCTEAHMHSCLYKDLDYTDVRVYTSSGLLSVGWTIDVQPLSQTTRNVTNDGRCGCQGNLFYFFEKIL